MTAAPVTPSTATTTMAARFNLLFFIGDIRAIESAQDKTMGTDSYCMEKLPVSQDFAKTETFSRLPLIGK
jgi:hypothetical protein